MSVSTLWARPLLRAYALFAIAVTASCGVARAVRGDTLRTQRLVIHLGSAGGELWQLRAAAGGPVYRFAPPTLPLT